MRNWIAYPTLLLAALFAPGCPYEAKVPIGAPAPRPLDLRFTGQWVWDDPKGEAESVLMTVRPFDASQYLVTLLHRDQAPTSFRAYPVDVGKETFWNLNEVEDGFPPQSYVFTRCSLTANGELSLRFVGKKVVPASLASDAEGLVAFLEKHLADPELDDQDRGLYLWRRPRDGEIEKGLLVKPAGEKQKPGTDAPEKR